MQKNKDTLRELLFTLSYFNKIAQNDIAVGLTDLKEYIGYFRAKNFELNVPTGTPIKGITAIEECIRTGRETYCDFPAETWGVAIRAIYAPIFDDDGNVIGTISSGVKLADSAEALKAAKQRDNSNMACYSFDDLIFHNKKMAGLIQSAKHISFKDTTILIQGESGTGKEILAQAIHNYGNRRNKAFVAVNCAALPKELIQSELFGYEEGTFTGAKKGGKAGKFELANGGTIFLDEIGDMPLAVQANLLRVLQEKNVVRVGGGHTIPLDVRVIAATNRDLLQDVEAGCFRRDLFYRLSVITLSIPSLRERKDDLEILIQHFMKKHAGLSAADITISPQVKKFLAIYDWPGNIRELENTVIYFLHYMSGNTVTVNHLPARFQNSAKVIPEKFDMLNEVEKQTVVEVFRNCGYNISLAASVLGITRATLYRKLKKFQISF